MRWRMTHGSNDQVKNDQGLESNTERWWQIVWRWLKNLPVCISYILTFRNYYYIEVMQALKKVESEYKTMQNIPHSPAFQFETLTAIGNAIEKLICDAEKEKNYSKIWPIVHQIELLLIKLYDDNMLTAHLSTVRNNLYVLEEKDQKLWESKLNEFENLNTPLVEKTVEKVTRKDEATVTEKVTYKTKAKTDDTEKTAAAAKDETASEKQKKNDIKIELLRALLYTITAAINEARRVEYMTNDLKRVLLRRIMWCTIICGIVSWVFAFSLIRDPLVNYAILLGLLGGFFSRLYSTTSLNFKPPAFSLLAQYSYVQPIIGGIGAVIMYFILLSPVGTEIINDSLYLSEAQTKQYIMDKFVADKQDTSWTKKYLPPFRVHTFISVDIKDTTAKKGTLLNQTSSAKQKPKLSKKSNAKTVTIPKPNTDTTSVDTTKIVSNPLITKYPKPFLLLILAFLAGFSEKFFMGTVNKIVGSKFITIESEEKKNEPKKETTTDKAPEKKPS
jgi:hypothetical protein